MSAQPNETFAVQNGYLVHSVVPRRGKPYVHRCPLAAFEQIAHAAEELGADGFVIESLVAYERDAGRDVTFTDVAVALAFLRERGIVDVRWRRNYAATQAVHLDAMTEFHALAVNA
jgi:CHASE2 domain-containing sensor protein